MKQRLLDGRNEDLAFVLADARQLMFSLAWVISGVLLAHDAQRDSDAIAVEVARRWVLDGEGGVGEFVLPEVAYARSLAGKRAVTNKERTNWDSRIVWGIDLPQDAALGYRKIVKETTTPSGKPEQVLARL